MITISEKDIIDLAFRFDNQISMDQRNHRIVSSTKIRGSFKIRSEFWHNNYNDLRNDNYKFLLITPKGTFEVVINSYETIGIDYIELGFFGNINRDHHVCFYNPS